MPSKGPREGGFAPKRTAAVSFDGSGRSNEGPKTSNDTFARSNERSKGQTRGRRRQTIPLQGQTRGQKVKRGVRRPRESDVPIGVGLRPAVEGSSRGAPTIRVWLRQCRATGTRVRLPRERVDRGSREVGSKCSSSQNVKLESRGPPRRSPLPSAFCPLTLQRGILSLA
jgi:hypothetical protein